MHSTLTIGSSGSTGRSNRKQPNKQNNVRVADPSLAYYFGRLNGMSYSEMCMDSCESDIPEYFYFGNLETLQMEEHRGYINLGNQTLASLPLAGVGEGI